MLASPAEIPPIGMENEMSESRDSQYTVRGMTCEHCVASVREEVGQVAGVSVVEVDLEGGRLAVGGEGYSDEAVAAAVAEAGYEVVL
jgi:copper chaperone CopZ